MKLFTRRVATVLFLIVTAAAGLAGAAQDPVRELMWDDLMPKDWDPFAKLRSLQDSGKAGAIEDGTAEADRIMKDFISAGRSAPVVQELNGLKIRLPGFVVPLDYRGTEVKEFLLVPYFGACIHVPPPPSNQIVYVKTPKPFPIESMSDAVWVTGVITTSAFLNEMGDAGYSLDAQKIEPYKDK